MSMQQQERTYQRTYQIFSIPGKGLFPDLGRPGAHPAALTDMLPGVQPEFTSYKFTSHGQTYATSAGTHQSNVSAAGVPAGAVAVLGLDVQRASNLALTMENIMVEQNKVTLDLKIAAPIEGSTSLSFVVNPDAVALDTATPLQRKDAAAFAALNPLCVLRCGGGQILPVLVDNLSSLSAGPAAFAAAVRAALPNVGIDILNCITSQCT